MNTMALNLLCDVNQEIPHGQPRFANHWEWVLEWLVRNKLKHTAIMQEEIARSNEQNRRVQLGV